MRECPGSVIPWVPVAHSSGLEPGPDGFVDRRPFPLGDECSANVTGFEPAPPTLTRWCPAVGRHVLAGMRGVEPRSAGPEPAALPLRHIPLAARYGARFGPAVRCFAASLCSAEARAKTPAARSGRGRLSPPPTAAARSSSWSFVPSAGVEPATSGASAGPSASWGTWADLHPVGCGVVGMAGLDPAALASRTPCAYCCATFRGVADGTCARNNLIHNQAPHCSASVTVPSAGFEPATHRV